MREGGCPLYRKSRDTAGRQKFLISTRCERHGFAPHRLPNLKQLHVPAGPYLSAGRAARLTYAFDMTIISTATATKHVDLWVPAAKITVLGAKLDGVSGIEIRRIVELLMATL